MLEEKVRQVNLSLACQNARRICENENINISLRSTQNRVSVWMFQPAPVLS